MCGHTFHKECIQPWLKNIINVQFVLKNGIHMYKFIYKFSNKSSSLNVRLRSLSVEKIEDDESSTKSV